MVVSDRITIQTDRRHVEIGLYRERRSKSILAMSH